jgi:putative ABC transport system permease protein
MLRNYLAAALRNLARNRLYAGVTIAGLAIGFAAAMLIGLYVRDEFTFDRFVPGRERIYLMTTTINLAGAKPIETKLSQIKLAERLPLDFPEIELAGRITGAYFPPTVRRGEIVAAEQGLFYADENYFRILRLPVLAGDLAHALDAPDAVVLTRPMARKYFGRDDPVGQTLLINREPFRVTAVLKDLPSNTHITAEIFASAKSPQSPISQYGEINGPVDTTLYTYVRLKPGVSPDALHARMASFLDRRFPLNAVSRVAVAGRDTQFLPLTKIHLTSSNQEIFNSKAPVDTAILVAIGGVGVLIVLVAAINFVTLMTARAARRAVEVGVRKAAGASRFDLIVQFMGEAVLYVAAAGILALALAELLMPAFNAFLQRKMVFDYLRDPSLGLSVLGAMAVIAILAGIYPALVLSSFRPAAVLKGGPVASVGGGRLRQVLVVAQFAVLIALALVAITIARQTIYALNEGMRLDKDQTLFVFSQPCSTTLRDEVRRLPGVKAAGCTSAEAMSLSTSHDEMRVGDRKANISRAPVDFGFFEVFGVRPVAGRLFDPRRPADGALDNPASHQPVVLNETAVRRLGFRSPQEAVGKTILWRGFWDETLRQDRPVDLPLKPSQIIGVVPDFTLGSLRQPIEPYLYAVGRIAPPSSVALAVKLDGKRVPETLAAMDRVWKRVGEGRPMMRYFVDQFTMRLYLDTIIQGATVAIAGVIALVVAALGLFALSAYTTERRTKEIGVRKAMGASSGDILKLLLWQFTKPVLWANLIAWPAAWLVLNWWLSGFAYRVDVAPWTFAAAGAGAVVIALATVFVHARNVARARPVAALRYE